MSAQTVGDKKQPTAGGNEVSVFIVFSDLSAIALPRSGDLKLHGDSAPYACQERKENDV
jgi:hypothetical protein